MNTGLCIIPNPELLCRTNVRVEENNERVEENDQPHNYCTVHFVYTVYTHLQIYPTFWFTEMTHSSQVEFITWVIGYRQQIFLKIHERTISINTIDQPDLTTLQETARCNLNSSAFFNVKSPTRRQLIPKK